MAQLLDKAKNYALDKLGAMKKPEATISDVDLKGVSRDCITYQAKFDIMNPYSHSLPICEVSYSLKSAGRVIASGTMEDPGSIKGDNQTTTLMVPMKVAHSVLVSLSKDICADWDIDYELEVGLTIDLPLLGNFTVPVSKKGEINLPALSDVL